MTDSKLAELISGGINFVLSLSEEEQKEFQKNSLAVKQAKSLCQSLLNEEERLFSAYFEIVRVSSAKVTGREKLSLKEINEQINNLLHQSIKSSGVINLFSDAEEEFSIFDEAFLEEIANMKEKNLAAELLKKLLNEQISVYQRTNLAQAEKFSERMMKLMKSYRNGMLSNAEVIDEMKKMARDIKNTYHKGEDLGLASEELAFYDALTKPEAIKDFYNNAELKAITQELVKELRKNRTIDWQQKEGARAGMRVMVKRLLKKI